MTSANQRSGHRFIKWALRALLALVVILIICILLVQHPKVQQVIVNKITEELSEKLGTPVAVGGVKIRFFDQIDVERLFIGDLTRDTLIYADAIHLDISLVSFLKKKITIDRLSTRGMVSKIVETEKDSHYNFSFLVKKTNGQSTDQLISRNKKTWEIDVRNISLSNFRLEFNSINEDSFLFIGGEVDIDLNAVNLDNQLVDIRKVYFEKTHFIQKSGPERLEYNEPKDHFKVITFLPESAWSLLIQEIRGSQNRINIQGPEAGFKTKQVNYQDIAMERLDIQLQDLKLTPDQLTAAIPNISFIERSGFTVQKFKAEAILSKNRIDINGLELVTPKSAIYNNLVIKSYEKNDIPGVATELEYESQFSDSKISLADLGFLSEQIENHVNIDMEEDVNLSGSVKGNLSGLELKKLEMKLGKKLDLRGDISVDFPDTGDTPKFLADITRLKTSYRSLKSIFPQYDIPKEIAHLGEINLKVRMAGDYEEMDIQHLTITASAGSEVAVDGKVRNLTQIDDLSFDLNFDTLYANSASIRPLMRIDSLDPLNDLTGLGFRGRLKGNIYSLLTQGSVTSNLGRITTDFQIDFDQDYATALYSGNLRVIDFDLGKFLRKSDIGLVSLEATATGEGWSWPAIQSEFDVVLNQLIYQDTAYENIRLVGTLNQGKLAGLLEMKNNLMDATIEGIINLSDSLHHFDVAMDVGDINLSKLGIAKTPLRAKFKSQANLSGNDINTLSGTLSFDHLSLASDSITFTTDAVTLTASQNEYDFQDIFLESNFLDAHLFGRLHYQNLPTIFNRFYQDIVSTQLYSQDGEFRNDPNDSERIDSFKLMVDLKDYTPFAVWGMSEIPSANEAKFELLIDEARRNLSLAGTISGFTFRDLFIEFIGVNGGVRNGIIETEIMGNQFAYKTVQVPHVRVTTEIDQSNILYQLSLARDSSFRYVGLSGSWIKEVDRHHFIIDESIVLNNEDWLVNKDHQIFWSQDDIVFDDFRLSSGPKSIRIDKVPGGSNFEVQFNHFPLEYFTNSLGANITGSLSGSVHVPATLSETSYRADLTVSDLMAGQAFLGELNFGTSDRFSSDELSIDFSLINKEQSLSGVGLFNKTTQDLNMDLRIERINFVTLEPFMEGILSNSKGFLDGQINVNGPFTDPMVTGDIGFNEMEAHLDFAGMTYRLNRHRLLIKENEIDIGDMIIVDDDGRLAQVSGKIMHEGYRNFVLDLLFSTEEFEFINTNPKVNDLFYGNLYLQANGTVKGPVDAPNLSFNARTLPKTELVISAYSEMEVIEGEQFVIFSTLEDYYERTEEYEAPKNSLPFFLTLNLELTDDATFSFIVDPGSGDRLTCSGQSNLTLLSNPSGNIEIYGTYTLTKGQYEFSYSEFLRKHFEIQQGSTVIFSGDPLNAVFNATAIYTAQTSTYELVKNETSLSSSEFLVARRRNPVNVLLSLSGQLSSPQIVFDIVVPSTNHASLDDILDEKLNILRENPGELNNQVFALLLMNNFMLPGSSSPGGPDFPKLGTSQALSSVSKLFTNNLNQLADKYIKGVEVHFDIDSYQTEESIAQTSSIVTQVGLGISKDLLGDRLRIQASGNLDFEEGDASNRYTSIVGNFVLEYKLTESGQYVLRVYRRDISDTITGERSAKNGVGILFKKSFDERGK